jgi:hypothetical protein
LLKKDLHKKRGMRPAALLEEAESRVNHKLKFGAQKQDKCGLGWNLTKRPEPDSKEYRRTVAEEVCKMDEAERTIRVLDMPMQGAWTTWEHVMSLDFSWQSLISGLSPKLLSFALNATQYTLPTPDRLRLWGKVQTGNCKLCGHSSGTLYHILCNCPFSLHKSRYNWRHDSVLCVIEQFLKSHIDSQNMTEPQVALTQVPFVRAGAKVPSKKHAQRRSCLAHANDWKLLVDFEDSKVIFPPEIYPTEKRPDIVIWSAVTKSIFVIELTVPSEEAIPDAQFRKKDKYQELINGCILNGWKAELMTVEIGMRGFVAYSFAHCLRRLGFSNPVVKKATTRVSKAALLTSYCLYVARNNPGWSPVGLLYDGSNSS